VKGQILDLIVSVMVLDLYFASVNYSAIYCHIFCNFYMALLAFSNLRTRVRAPIHTHTHTHTRDYSETCNCVRSYLSLHLVSTEDEEFT